MRLVERPRPVPGAQEVLIRIESTGVCGSDVHYYEDGRIGNQVITPPLILGHEYAGVVEEAGSEADAGLLGKRVAVEPGIPCGRCEWCRTGHYNVCREMFFPGGPGCDGAFAEYIAVHHAYCFPVPAGMSAAVAAMIEPLAVALHTVELAEVRPGDSVAIFGLGPIGLLTAQVSKLAGAGRVYGADLHAYRVAAGAAHGVDAGHDASREDARAAIWEATAGRGVDVAIDCTNRSAGMAQAVRVARPAGRCVLTGISGHEEDPLPVSDARRKELTLRWCRRFRFNYPAAIALLADGRVDVASLITHSFPLERCPEALALVSETGDGVLKVSIDQ
jgi:L-iditol 2-dehydrogenase